MLSNEPQPPTVTHIQTQTHTQSPTSSSCKLVNVVGGVMWFDTVSLYTIRKYSVRYIMLAWHASAPLLKALRYKPADRGFDSQ